MISFERAWRECDQTPQGRTLKGAATAASTQTGAPGGRPFGSSLPRRPTHLSIGHRRSRSAPFGSLQSAARVRGAPALRSPAIWRGVRKGRDTTSSKGPPKPNDASDCGPWRNATVAPGTAIRAGARRSRPTGFDAVVCFIPWFKLRPPSPEQGRLRRSARIESIRNRSRPASRQRPARRGMCRPPSVSCFVGGCRL
jgi:hypothetical protein